MNRKKYAIGDALFSGPRIRRTGSWLIDYFRGVSLPGSVFSLILGASFFGPGCGPKETIPLAPNTQNTQTTQTVQNSPKLDKTMPTDLPLTGPKDQQMQPSTLLALGLMHEQTASDPQKSPEQREQLRARARELYEKALKRDGKYVQAQQALARLELTSGNRERGNTLYQQLLKDHPRDASIWLDLGMSYARIREWDNAIETLRKGVELAPDNRRGNKMLGHCLARAGRYDEALAVFRSMDGEAQAHYELARMLQHMKQEELCKYHLQQALVIDPKLTPARYLLAQMGYRPAEMRESAPYANAQEMPPQSMQESAPTGYYRAAENMRPQERPPDRLNPAAYPSAPPSVPNQYRTASYLYPPQLQGGELQQAQALVPPPVNRPVPAAVVPTSPAAMNGLKPAPVDPDELEMPSMMMQPPSSEKLRAKGT